jgi:hypothetical protein
MEKYTEFLYLIENDRMKIIQNLLRKLHANEPHPLAPSPLRREGIVMLQLCKRIISIFFMKIGYAVIL